MNTPVRFFIDFDGTITTVDVVDALLQRFADKSWTAVEKDWTEGRIGSRECLERQIRLVRATRKEIDELVLGIGVDAYFVPFLESAKKNGTPVSVVSDGFELLIDKVLKKSVPSSLLKGVQVFSNRLEWDEKGPKAVFSPERCEHGCANCKPRVLRKTAAEGQRVVFVGDGLSDRFAAEEADLTFAKRSLLEYCREREIRHKAYTDFKSILEWVESGCILEAAESGCHGGL